MTFQPSDKPVWLAHKSGRTMRLAFDARTLKTAHPLPILAYDSDHRLAWYHPTDFDKVLQECEDFDLPKPPVPFPVWCIPDKETKTVNGKTIAYWKYNDNQHGLTFHTDGTSFEFCGADLSTVPLNCIVTEGVAMARLTSIDCRQKPLPETPRTYVKFMAIRDYLDSRGAAVLVLPESADPPTNEAWVELKKDSDGRMYVEGSPARCGFHDERRVRCSLNSQHKGKCKFDDA